MRKLLAIMGAAVCISGCPTRAVTPPPVPTPTVTPTNTAVTFDIGEKPSLDAAKPFNAPQPLRYKTPNGITVWLLEQPSFPVVSIALSIPSGSSADPVGKAGLAHITSSMLDEGAGDRDAITISTEINDLGADLWTSARVDGSRVQLSTLAKHLDRAFPIFADVVARPRFEASEWKRVTELWHNSLKRRADNPRAVASVVRRAVLYGPDTPYGHSPSGHTDTAKAITLDEAKKFYADHWRPDRAQIVAAGAIDKARLDALLSKHLGDWKASGPDGLRGAVAVKPLAERPRLVIVDRPEAPQAVITVANRGVTANDPEAPLLDLVNTALGGSFTSRLNQNLREDHGWTYGARSAFTESKGVGVFIASAAVFTNVTAPALREMLGEIDKMAASGLTQAELGKVRAHDLTDLVEGNETVGDIVSRLTQLATLGMPADFDAKASVARQAATLERLNALAKKHLDTKTASVIVVGPRDQLVTQLRALDLGTPEMWSAEGRPIER